jgi:hypothetical protein
MASSCPGDKSATNDNSNILTNRAQYYSNLTQNDNAYIKKRACKQSTGFYPSFTPSIYSLSPNTSKNGTYSLVYISGNNFQSPPIATTYINFTNSSNSYTKLPITFFSSSYISFVVPISAPAGTYSVVAVNIYNGNFSPQVNNVYPGILNYSKPVNYVLT